MRSLGVVEHSCEHCGNPMTSRVCRPRRFCSQACKYAARVKTVERVCAQCGQPFTTSPTSTRRYCSNACVGAAKLRPVEVTCVQCGAAFTKSPSRVSPYCTAACYDADHRRPLAERFWRHVQKTEGCWLWTGGKDKAGYGIIEMKDDGRRRMAFAHRVAYELVNGPIPDGKNCCHTCDNPPCVRPAHLFPGSHADNVADMVAKGRQSKGETRPLAKLDVADAAAIKACPHEALRVLADRYGVSISTISHIRGGRTWKDA